MISIILQGLKVRYPLATDLEKKELYLLNQWKELREISKI